MTKVTSPELAALAARTLPRPDATETEKRLAASVLAQYETPIAEDEKPNPDLRAFYRRGLDVARFGIPESADKAAAREELKSLQLPSLMEPIGT